MRDDQQAAKTAQQTAGNNAAGYGAQASTISSQLLPYMSRQLTNPSGYSQQDIGAQLTSALAGAGGATAGLAGAASKDAATTRNPMGFSAALDAAAMQRDKAAAGASEGIASKNADVKLNQQNAAAQGLSGMYGMDTRAQAEAAQNQTSDINAGVNAGNSGWLQNGLGILNTINRGTGSALDLQKLFQG